MNALAEAYRTLRSQLEAGPGLSAQRALLETLHQQAAEPEAVGYRDEVIAGVPVLWCEPEDRVGGATLVYLHGGGYVAGSPRLYRKLAGHLARASGAAAVVPAYRLAPEHAHPAASDDVIALYGALVERGRPAGRLVLVGDSAGAGLCATAVLRLKAGGRPLPAGVVAISPFFDLGLTGGSLDVNGEVDAIISRPMLRAAAASYLQGADPTDPLINPLHADLAGFPPVLIHVGSAEALLDDSLRFADRARAAGVDVAVHIGDDLQHVYPLAAGRSPEADGAVACMAAWIRRRVAHQLPSSETVGRSTGA